MMRPPAMPGHGVSHEDLRDELGALRGDVERLRARVMQLELRVTGAALGGVALAEVARILLERLA